MFGNAAHKYEGTPQPEHLVSGSTFDGDTYQIALETTEVARGASGKIFRGKILGTVPWIVAVKVIPGLLDPVLEALLARELRAARAISVLHPYILPFLGTADVGGRTGIVSVFMDNGNLKQYIECHRTCDKKKLIIQVAEAISFLHATMGLVHGDIKCENILISYLGDAMLADFGLSTFAEKSRAATATMTAIRAMNTLQFAAPELLLGEGTTIPSKTRESDVYAFGMLALEALSGNLPWPNHNNLSIMQKVCSGQHPSRPTSNGPFVSISHSWWQTCQSCWRFDPGERPQITDVLWTLKATEPSPCWVLPIDEHVEVAAYMPDGRTVVAASSQSIILLNTSSGNIRRLQHPYMYFGEHGLAVSPDGQHIAIACPSERIIRVVDAASGAPVAILQHDDLQHSVTYSRDGTRIASGTSRGTVLLWDAATGAASGRNLDGHSEQVSGVSFAPDGICLASASEDGTICLWDCTMCTCISTLALPDPLQIFSMEFSPASDHMHVVAGYDAGMVVVWDVRERLARHTFQMGSDVIFDVAFSPNGKYVAAGSESGDISIWDIQDGTQVRAPFGMTDGCVVSVVFSPDGKSLICSGGDRELSVWDLFD